MQNDPHTPDTGIISRLPKPSLRQRRVIAMGTAAAVVVVGLGAFALLPPVRMALFCLGNSGDCVSSCSRAKANSA